ncbi:outer membrane lipoprotein carrier protein LolA [Pseudosulfitobacter sp. DSM 107133]|uniref:LolA family protein n=1 Tax=Pseudosulfitobacter sp. DSM 107133 TaxID=2883100 RepID=UPI000DF2A179|nr:outer membrane lipoprotein carrier protein LolA [Pseudosulfitobacter sp. DSM 107133]UOA25577.1 Outer-membrane lipoprotein carrier protein [Pseudosulfitobacter sp. DSM 107133]
MLSLRTFLPACAIALSVAGAAAADKLPLNEISKYLNTLRTVQGDFTQINDDGSISTGQIFIKRPGRVRFEYNAPETALVVAGAGAVVIYDSKSNAPPETYPLAKTPLSIILADNVNLGQARMVTGHDYDGTATTVTAQDPEHPDYGNIQLKFTGNPVQLRQWVINDSSGSSTTVVLGDLKIGGKLANSMFDTGSPGQAPPR